LLLASAFLLLLPVPSVFGSSGHPALGVVNSATAPTTITDATAYVSVIAGHASATTDTETAGFLAIDFGTGCTASGCSLVSFSGSGFYLYLSTSPLSEIGPTDILYAGGASDHVTFTVAALSGTYTAVNEINGTFHIGQVAGHGVLEGPIPTKISSAYKYIKIFDGTSTSVAVSAEYIDILPGISVTPTQGAAGTSVAVSGGGFPMNTNVGINYTFSYTSWAGVVSTKSGMWISSGISTGTKGWFTAAAPMTDTKQVYNPGGESPLIPLVKVTLLAVNASTPKEKPAFTTGAGDAAFNETSRVFNQEISYLPGDVAAYSNPEGTYGNDTAHTPYLSTLGAYVTGSIGIEGNYSVVGSTVTVTLGSNTVTVTSNGISGKWIANITVPTLPSGAATVYVVDNGVTYNFEITILPTLVLTPTSGPAGTVVTATAYGFAPTGIKHPIIIYWYELAEDDGLSYWLVNATVGALGTFNTTGGVHFTVPVTFGGPHDVFASIVCATPGTCKAGGYTSALSEEDVESYAVFTVTPTLVICNGSTCGAGDTPSDTITVSANTRTLLTAVGQGFEPYWIFVNIDNAQYSDCDTYVSGTGNTTLGFTAAGFSPGLHQVDTYLCYDDDDSGYYQTGPPVAVAYFNVTGVTPSSSLPPSLITTIDTINTNVQTILGWGTMITNINNNVNTIYTNVNTINTNVKTILGWQSTIININSTVNGLKTTLAAMQTTLGTVATDLGTTTLASVYTAAQAASTAATAASTAATNTKSAVNDTETYALVLVVLVAITLVLELAVLIRKLD
jgi:hypothetical protein